MNGKKVYFILAIAMVLYAIYAVNASSYYHRTKWLDLTFRARVSDKVKTAKFPYYRFTKNDSLFELKGSFSSEFINTVTVGDSIYKIKGINYCIIFQKSGKIKSSKF